MIFAEFKNKIINKLNSSEIPVYCSTSNQKWNNINIHFGFHTNPELSLEFTPEKIRVHYPYRNEVDNFDISESEYRQFVQNIQNICSARVTKELLKFLNS